jgi:uncharacterized protein (UPF0147 family)
VESLEIYSKAKKVVTLSEQMLAMAHQSEWLLFEKTEQQRQKLLTEIFSDSNVNEMLPKIASFLQQILNYDSESLQLGEQARIETLQELSTLHSNVNAVGAYQQLSSLETPK